MGKPKLIVSTALALLLAAAPAWPQEPVSTGGNVIIQTGAALLRHRLTLENAPAELCFSPRGGCTEMLVRAIDEARKSIYVQAYSFTSPQIIAALIRAHERGLDVRVIVDRGQKTAKGSGLEAVARAGIPIWVDEAHAIAHNKIIVIDGLIVYTGSFNFTASAELRNAENQIGIESPALARLYLDNWEAHRRHSTLWTGR